MLGSCSRYEYSWLHKDVCIESKFGRGTEENPGLVCGAEKNENAFIVGKVLFNNDGDMEFIRYIENKELRSNNYFWDNVGLIFVNGILVDLDILIANPLSSAYVRISLEEQVKYIRSGYGTKGGALNYYMRIERFVSRTGFEDSGINLIKTHI